MRRAIVLLGTLCVAALVIFAIVGTPLLSAMTSSRSTVLNLKASGLASYYAVNNTSAQDTSFGGNAAAGNASYRVFDDSAFLHIGVKAPANGSWAGYYLVTPSTYATLVQAVIVAPGTNVTGYFTNGIYIQASNQVLNYVTCVAVTNSTGTYWMVIHASNPGTSPTAPTTYQNLWHDPAKHQAQTRVCELITNGQKDLTVYLDHIMVYHSNSLSLGMQEPFNFFVGVESESADQLTFGSARDFYVTHGEYLNITGLPKEATVVELVDSQGKLIMGANVKSGSASINVGAFAFPMTGYYIKAYSKMPSSGNNSTGLLASTPSPVSVYGGDVYTLSAKPSTTSQLNINSEDASGNQLNGYYTVLMRDGHQVAQDWLPTSFTLQNGQTYTIMVSDYGNYVFDHWSDGSISRIKTISIASNTGVTAVFRDKSSPPSSGHSLITVSAVNSSGNAVTGLYVTLWQDGFIVSQAYSPASFVVSNDATYQVMTSNFGSYTFQGWEGGVNETLYTVTTGNGSTSNVVAVYNDS